MSAPSSNPDLGRLSAWAAFVGVAVAGLVLLLYGCLMVAYPRQAEYGEGVALQLTMTVSEHQPLYRDPAQYPWLVDPYAPLFTGLCAVLRPLFGLTFAAGRLISLLAACGTAVLLSWMAFVHGGRRASVFTAALFLCCPLTLGWAVLYRVDFLGLFLEVAALCAVDVALRRKAWPWLWLAAALFSCAFFTKQTFLLGLAASLFTVFGASRRHAAWLALGAAVAIGVPFLWLNAGCDGRLFSSLFSNNVMPWSWERARPWLTQYGMLIGVGCCVALAGVRHLPRLWQVYFGLTVLTLLGVGRIGAYYNHFLPFHAALSVAAGIAGANLTRGTGARSRVVAVALVAQVALGLFLGLEPTLPSIAEVGRAVVRRFEQGAPSVIRAARAGLAADIATLNRFPGDVVAENMGLPVLAGRPPVMCDPSTLFAMAEAGRWNENAFLAAVRAHRFGVILLQKTGHDNLRFSARAIDAIGAYYTKAADVSGDTLLVPSGAGPNFRAAP